MATTSPINGLPTPDDASPNDPPIHFGALNTVLDTRLVPRFTTTTARNNAITAPVEGMECVVAGYPQVYRAGAWHGMSTQIYSTTTFDGTSYTAGQVVATISVPDPGYPYKIVGGAGAFLAQVGAGCTIRPYVRVNGTALNPAGWPAVNTSGGTITNQQVFVPGCATSGTLTGASTVTLLLAKEAGPVGNGFQVAQPNAANMLSVMAIPV